MSQSTIPPEQHPLWVNFRIAVRDVAEGYTCTLEARQKSGGLGNHTAEEPPAERHYGMSPLGASFYG